MRLLPLFLLAAALLPAQPNILIFIADDQGMGDLGAYGHPTLRTPNVDRLAAEGLRFDRAFLTISSCSPSRSSILTGRYPHSTGAEDLHDPLPADQHTLARYLKASNYHNVSVGKWHLGGAEQAHWASVTDCPGVETAQHTIKQLRQRPKDKPFFFWVASKDPHRPFDTEGLPETYSPAEVVVPPYLPDHPLIRQDLALYYAELTRFDHHVGEIRAELEAQGVLDNTVIVYLSDNGMPFPRAKTTLYDSGIRTPLIIRYPPVVPAGLTQRALFSVVDLIPTLLDLLGVEASTLQGTSRLAMWEDPLATGATEIYAEANWHDFEQFTRAVRSDRYLPVRNYYWQFPLWNSVDSVNSITWQGFRAMLQADKLTPAQAFLLQQPRPYEEFYDLQVDPHSLRNVVSEQRYEAALNHHRALLDNWRVHTNDEMPPEPRLDGWTRDGNPLPHNQPWYDRWVAQGGKNDFEKF